MSGVAVSTQDIAAAAREFERGSKESQQLLERLEKVADGLKQGWSGETRDAFFKHQAEWHTLMRAQAAMLISISLELRALADRFQRADS
jgi:WXG100 family type VII secretion target